MVYPQSWRASRGWLTGSFHSRSGTSQVRLRGASVFFFVACVICYTFANFGSCSSFMLSWLGYLPMQASARRGGE